jgi:arginase
MTPPFAIVEAPSSLGLSSSGVERLPDALLSAGLSERLATRRAGRVEPPSRRPGRDPATGMLNPQGIASYSVLLADKLGPLLDAGEVPLVLGGDCSILLGSLLALRRRGRFGLFYVDGHADFYAPEAEPKGEAASMDLAIATGHGPGVVTDLEGRRPLVRLDDVVAFGFRDPWADPAYAQGELPPDLKAMDLREIEARGLHPAVAEALAYLTRVGGPERFWLHLDADVLDDAVMPAVEYRMDGGLSFRELSDLLAASVSSGKLAGIEVTIFDPTLDPSGEVARNFTEALARGLEDRR